MSNSNNKGDAVNCIGDVVVFDERNEKCHHRTSTVSSNAMRSSEELVYSTRNFPASPPAATSRTCINNGMELKHYLMQQRLHQQEKLIVSRSTSTGSSTGADMRQQQPKQRVQRQELNQGPVRGPGSMTSNAQVGAGRDKASTVRRDEQFAKNEVCCDYINLYGNGDDEEQGSAGTPRQKKLSPLFLESLGLSESEVGSLADESCSNEEESPFDVIPTTQGDWVGIRNKNTTNDSSSSGVGAFEVIDVHDDGYERGDRQSSSSDNIPDEEQDRFSDDLSLPSILPLNNDNDYNDINQKYRNRTTVSNNTGGSLRRSSGASFDSNESSIKSNVQQGQRLSYIHKREMEELLAVVDKQTEEAQRLQWKQEMETKSGARSNNTAGNAMELCAFLALMILTIVIGATTSTAPEQPFPGFNVTLNGTDGTNMTAPNDWMSGVVVAGGSPTPSPANTPPVLVATTPPIDPGAGVVPTSSLEPPPPSQQQQQQQQQQVPIIAKQNNSTTVDIVGTNVTQGDAEVPP